MCYLRKISTTWIRNCPTAFRLTKWRLLWIYCTVSKWPVLPYRYFCTSVHDVFSLILQLHDIFLECSIEWIFFIIEPTIQPQTQNWENPDFLCVDGEVTVAWLLHICMKVSELLFWKTDTASCYNKLPHRCDNRNNHQVFEDVLMELQIYISLCR